MNKKIVTIIIGAVAAVTFAGCNSDKPEAAAPVVERQPEVTATTVPAPVVEEETDIVDYEMLSTCIDSSESINEGLDAMSDGVELLPYVDDAAVLDFLATAKEFVQTSKVTTQLCAEFTPAESAAMLDSLEELELSIDSLADTYATSY